MRRGHGERVPVRVPTAGIPAADIRFPYVTAAYRRFNSPRNETPRLVILDESYHVSRRASRFRLPSPLRPGSAISRSRGDSPACFRLFSQLLRAPFQFSFRLLVHYRTLDMFRLGWSVHPYSTGNSGPVYSVPGNQHIFAYGAVALFGLLFQASSARCVEVLPVPHLSYLSERDSGWPLPVSLAVTSGIAFAFFSCPYWNALVRGVPDRGLTSSFRAKNFTGRPG